MEWGDPDCCLLWALRWHPIARREFVDAREFHAYGNCRSSIVPPGPSDFNRRDPLRPSLSAFVHPGDLVSN